ncbi:hypothetical protein FGL74_02095 [Leuconostoc koreense]|nr:hypothetical protein FGL74_02095 [Leuconostoc mesenteroides]QGM24475.1 hypothetical protein GJV51_00075 [Leuconostoc mesenteroides subsp. mesenteroides]
MKQIFQLIGAVVTVIIGLLIFIPIILTIIGVAVPVVLSIIGIAFFVVLIIAAVAGIIGLITFWRFRKNIKDNEFEFVRNGKHFNIHISKDGADVNNRRDVTNDDAD